MRVIEVEVTALQYDIADGFLACLTQLIKIKMALPEKLAI